MSSCTLINEYTEWTKCVLVCRKKARAPQLDNSMPWKLCRAKKVGWHLIDLIILLLYKDKRWMPSYLLGTKWTSLPKMMGEDIKHFEPEWKDLSVPTVRRSAGKLYLQTNLVSELAELFLLMLDKAFIISEHPQQGDDKRPTGWVKVYSHVNYKVPLEALLTVSQRAP